VLAYGFTVNRQFAAKTDQNSVFLGCDPRIPDPLYIKVLYLCFDGFSKFSIFCQNSYVFAYGFIKNRQFAIKTDQNLVLLGRDTHIPYWLYIMVMYMSFHGFSKF
jgi:hypothetical protein